MPIDVHCPNPICAKVHKVKNRYAGARGKCPACGSWMYVPTSGGLPSGVGNQGMMLEDSASTKDPSGTSVAQKPTRKFSRLAAFFVFLGMIGLGAICAAPQLAGPTIEVTGDFAESLPNRTLPGINLDEADYALYVPAGIAGAALLCLLIALVQGRFGVISLFLLYVVSAASWLVLLVALTSWHTHQVNINRIEKAAQQGKEKGKVGDIIIFSGQQMHAAAGGAVVASLFFFLALLAAHGRWWSKLLSFLIVGIPLGLAPVWIFRQEIGVEEWLPEPLSWVADVFNQVRMLLGQ